MKKLTNVNKNFLDASYRNGKHSAVEKRFRNIIEILRNRKETEKSLMKIWFKKIN